MYDFILEGTTVEVDYSFPEATAGNQVIYYRFHAPSQESGVLCYSENAQDGEFHMYLAGRELACGEALFLTSILIPLL